MKIIVGSLLVLSPALNIFLWNRLSSQDDQLKSAQTSASEIDELRQQNQELEGNRTNRPEVANGNTLELARLRNENGQFRRNAGDAATMRKQAEEVTRLRPQPAGATQNLARAESELANVARLTPEQLKELKEDAQSLQCINNMKQIVLAARMWADDHHDVFPPDFLSMKDEMSTPKILFCPADTAAIPVAEWTQLNPSSISYRFLNPNGNVNVWTNRLTTCPIHGHVGLSDGSVHRN